MGMYESCFAIKRISQETQKHKVIFSHFPIHRKREFPNEFSIVSLRYQWDGDFFLNSCSWDFFFLRKDPSNLSRLLSQTCLYWPIFLSLQPKLKRFQCKLKHFQSILPNALSELFIAPYTLTVNNYKLPFLLTYKKMKSSLCLLRNSKLWAIKSASCTSCSRHVELWCSCGLCRFKSSLQRLWSLSHQ